MPDLTILYTACSKKVPPLKKIKTQLLDVPQNFLFISLSVMQICLKMIKVVFITLSINNGKLENFILHSLTELYFIRLNFELYS